MAFVWHCTAFRMAVYGGLYGTIWLFVWQCMAVCTAFLSNTQALKQLDFPTLSRIVIAVFSYALSILEYKFGNYGNRKA